MNENDKVELTEMEMIEQLAKRCHADAEFVKVYPSEVDQMAADWRLYTPKTTQDKYDTIELIYEIEYQLRTAHQKLKDWMRMKKDEKMPKKIKRYMFTKVMNEVLEDIGSRDDWVNHGVMDTEPRNYMIHVLIKNVADEMGMKDEQLYVPEGYFQ